MKTEFLLRPSSPSTCWTQPHGAVPVDESTFWKLQHITLNFSNVIRDLRFAAEISMDRTVQQDTPSPSAGKARHGKWKTVIRSKVRFRMPLYAINPRFFRRGPRITRIDANGIV